MKTIWNIIFVAIFAICGFLFLALNFVLAAAPFVVFIAAIIAGINSGIGAFFTVLAVGIGAWLGVLAVIALIQSWIDGL